MKIARVETFLVPPRWLFCRIETDDGLVGWGEPIVEGRAATVRTAVGELAELITGMDPLRIEDLWQIMTKSGFYRGGPVLSSAVAGIDQALWDIAGRYRNAPVHELLGGPVRDRIRMYSWVGGDDPSELADSIREKIDLGFTAVKMNGTGRHQRLANLADTREVLTRAELARETLGPANDFAMDFHGRVTLADSARLIPQLAPYHPLFIEEPVLPEYTHLIERLIGPVPIATGERLFSRGEFLAPLRAGIAVAQPDISHAGGITEVRKIATLAETFDCGLAPHCPLGPITLAASLQVGFASPNLLIQEQSLGIHYNVGNDLLDYLVDRSAFNYVDGHVERLTGPGLGIDIDEKVVRELDAKGHDWHSPVWRHDDGAHAEW